MRISTNTIYEKGIARMGEGQSALAKTQEQIATGRRVQTPADDPVGAARALELTQAQAMNTQYGVNRQNAKNSLSFEEHVLQSVTSLIQDVQGMVVTAGNAALDSSQRSFLATELTGRLEELFGHANTRDGAGNYVFAGYNTATQPFLKTGTGASYSGDQGQRMLQVGPARQLAISDSGSEVFQTIRTGSGMVTTSANSANSGSGVVSNGTMVSGATLSKKYEIVFNNPPTTFEVNDVTNPLAPVAIAPGGFAFVSGQTLTVDGTVQLNITGTPAATDKFRIESSSNQDLFKTITDLIGVLNGAAAGAGGQAKLANGLNTASNNLANALDNVLTVRASVGSRLKEIESLDIQGDDRDVQYAQSLAELQDLDYTKALTDLSKQKIMLEAAQQAFVKTSGLSLFDYLR